MEVICSSETSVDFHHTTRRYVVGTSNFTGFNNLYFLFQRVSYQLIFCCLFRCNISKWIENKHKMQGDENGCPRGGMFSRSLIVSQGLLQDEWLALNFDRLRVSAAELFMPPECRLFPVPHWTPHLTLKSFVTRDKYYRVKLLFHFILPRNF
jgi:hypothetical protein